MLKIINEDFGANLKYVITDNETGETLLAADNLIQLFLVFQDCFYSVVNMETDGNIIIERLRLYRHCQTSRKG